MALTKVQGGMVGNSGVATLDGIQFPAVQVPSSDPNCLDDYEEGTYTPSLRGIGTAGTFSPNGAQTGYYIKIGKLVYAQFDVGGSVSGSTSSLGIALPFTGGTGSYPGSFCCGYYSVGGATNATWIGGYVDQGTAFVTVTYNASSNTTVVYYPVPAGNIRFIGTVMFEVA